MKTKTADLTGPALDWAVAKCEGYKPVYTNGSITPVFRPREDVIAFDLLNYSTSWEQAGPIIEREKLCVGYKHQCDPGYAELLDTNTLCWARTTAGGYLKHGPTPLIAAMRCFVASRLGDEINIPEELL